MNSGALWLQKYKLKLALKHLTNNRIKMTSSSLCFLETPDIFICMNIYFQSRNCLKYGCFVANKVQVGSKQTLFVIPQEKDPQQGCEPAHAKFGSLSFLNTTGIMFQSSNPIYLKFNPTHIPQANSNHNPVITKIHIKLKKNCKQSKPELN